VGTSASTVAKTTYMAANLSKPPCKTNLGDYLYGFAKVRGLEIRFCCSAGDVIHH
jgi:hypothetical protein